LYLTLRTPQTWALVHLTWGLSVFTFLYFD
jgi:hypothetical protein